MGPSAFDVLKYVDQGNVFGRVHMALAHGKCLGVSELHASHFFHAWVLLMQTGVVCVVCPGSILFTECGRLCCEGKTLVRAHVTTPLSEKHPLSGFVHHG